MRDSRPHLLIALPGLHRVSRGAEVAFECVAQGLAASGEFAVTMIGSGPPKSGRAYQYLSSGMISRERFRGWPRIPPLRSEYRYEELSFVPGLLRRLAGLRADVAMTCSYPFVSWALRSLRTEGGGRAAQIFVTQNGDWAARRLNAEYRLFSCDGLVCTNREYFARHRAAWNCALIPNGLDVERFRPGAGDRAALGLPSDARVVVMASAFIPSKFVENGIRAVARLDGVHLVVAGDGPLRAEGDELGARLLGKRYRRVSLPPEKMPDFYRSADVFLHLSRDEAFGNVYVEALGCGIPVVAHDYDTTRWICDGHGWLGDTTDVDAVAALLETALTRGHQTSSASAAESVRGRFAWPVVVRAYADFLHETLARKVVP